METSFEREFFVKLDFNCRGHEIDIGFRTDNGFHAIKPSTKQQEIKLTGKKLLLVDNTPQKTEISTFDLGCELKISELKESLSANSQAKLKSYEEELTRLSNTVEDLKKTHDQLIDLMLAIEHLNPENMNWAITTLSKIAAKLSVLVNDPIFSSKSLEILAFKEAVVRTKEVLQRNLVGRVQEILNRMDEIIFEAMDLSAFSDSTKLEEKVVQAKSIFNGGLW